MKNTSCPLHIRCVQGAVFMCKKNELFGSCLMAVGAGPLLSLMFASEFAMAFIGIGLLVCGLFCARR